MAVIEAPTNGVPFNHLIAHDIEDLDSRGGRERMIDKERMEMRCEQRDIYTNQREEKVAEDRGTKSNCLSQVTRQC
jgi:hypothetical protein